MVSHDLWAWKRKTVFHGNWNPRAWECRFRIPLPGPTAVLSYLNIKFQYFKFLKFAVQRPAAPLSAKQCVFNIDLIFSPKEQPLLYIVLHQGSLIEWEDIISTTALCVCHQRKQRTQTWLQSCGNWVNNLSDR